MASLIMPTAMNFVADGVAAIGGTVLGVLLYGLFSYVMPAIPSSGSQPSGYIPGVVTALTVGALFSLLGLAASFLPPVIPPQSLMVAAIMGLFGAMNVNVPFANNQTAGGLYDDQTFFINNYIVPLMPVSS